MKTDSQLKKDVLAELEWDPAINATEIGVEVKDGVVTLAGHLASYAEKFAAEHAVQRVAGVKAIAMEIDIRIPGASRRTDAEIGSAASDALYWNAMVPNERVKVKVEDAWITLTGEVDWEFQRAAAESAVRYLTSVRGVSNLIRIKTKASQANVKTKIEAALSRAARHDADAIKVSVDGGKVTLKGKVHSYAERQMIADATWSAPGVSSVIDEIAIVD